MAIFGSVKLPTSDSVYSTIEAYPYVLLQPLSQHDKSNNEAIADFIRSMRWASKVVGAPELENVKHIIARLADHEVAHRFPDGYDHKASYYDVSGLPVRIFYRGRFQPDRPFNIYTPLKLFSRRDPFHEGGPSHRQKSVETRAAAWKLWEEAQADPVYGPIDRDLPTHVSFPRCLTLLLSPPPVKPQPSKVISMFARWCENPKFQLKDQPFEDRPHIEDLWTQEPIPVDPNNPVYSSSSSAAHRDGKVRVDKEERRDGSPSSPFVSLLRRDVLENGHKVGSPAFFFVRIEEVDGKYVPWRGPPRVPPSHPSPSSPELSLRKRLIYYK